MDEEGVWKQDVVKLHMCAWNAQASAAPSAAHCADCYADCYAIGCTCAAPCAAFDSSSVPSCFCSSSFWLLRLLLPRLLLLPLPRLLLLPLAAASFTSCCANHHDPGDSVVAFPAVAATPAAVPCAAMAAAPSVASIVVALGGSWCRCLACCCCRCCECCLTPCTQLVLATCCCCLTPCTGLFHTTKGGCCHFGGGWGSRYRKRYQTYKLLLISATISVGGGRVF